MGGDNGIGWTYRLNNGEIISGQVNTSRDGQKLLQK